LLERVHEQTLDTKRLRSALVRTMVQAHRPPPRESQKLRARAHPITVSPWPSVGSRLVKYRYRGYGREAVDRFAADSDVVAKNAELR
jgi:hypothetical protein